VENGVGVSVAVGIVKTVWVGLTVRIAVIITAVGFTSGVDMELMQEISIIATKIEGMNDLLMIFTYSLSLTESSA